MGAQENKKLAEAAYRAFSEGNAEAAMANMDDSIVWTTRGDNSLTGVCHGKEEVAELWGRLAEKGFSTEPHEFIADGDKVVVLTTARIDGESAEDADVLTFDADGRLIAFDSLGDPTAANRIFAS